MLNVDKFLLRIIAISRLFFCLYLLAITPFLFNYGGAAVHPGRFHTYLLFSTSMSLFSGGRAAHHLCVLAIVSHRHIDLADRAASSPKP